MADAEAMGRLISLALRSGIPLPSIHRQLRGISSDRAVGLGPNKVLSVPDAIGIALEDWWRDKHQGVQAELLPPDARQAGVPALEQVTVDPVVRPSDPSGSAPEPEQLGFDMSGYTQSFMGTCPDCGSQLEFAEGCVKCHVCGFSECG
jgi:ribonucleoside-diphosphate reductase alpha chain